MAHGKLEELERLLRQRLSVAGGSPFIAHCEVEPGLKTLALQELVRRVAGDIQILFQIILLFPCACTWAIATSLASSYGEEGDSNVYRPIARCLGLGEDIPLNYREILHDCFRRTCHKLGLTLPLNNGTKVRMVDDYLFQAGVSESQLEKLAQGFLRAERILGLPQKDDTRQVDDWEDRAVEFAPPGLAVLRRIVKEDATGFHATTFIDLRRETESSSASGFEGTFRAALQKVLTSTRGAAPDQLGPSLEFNEGELRVAVPPGAKALEIRLGSSVHRVSGGCYLALPAPWPAEIQWQSRRSEGTSSTWQPLGILSDPSRILVFDGESGLRKCELDPTPQSAGTAPAGLLCLLARQPFEANGERSHALGECAEVLYCEVSDGLTIRARDQEFKVDVDPRLRLQVTGTKIIRNQQAWLLAKPTAVQVCGEMGSASRELEVRITHAALGGTHRLRVQTSPEGTTAAGLSLPDSGEFDMARVSLHIEGQERALYRCRFWYWPGLERFVDGRLFEAVSIPENLSEGDLAHIVRSSNGCLALQEDEAYLRAHLSFRVNRRIVRFEFPPPGEAVSVRTSDGMERPLETGASLTVRDDYASSLIVRCDDPTAAIDLKGRFIQNAFGKIGYWRVSFATLMAPGAHNRVCLIRNRSHNPTTDLVKIVPEAEPKSFAVNRIGSRQTIEADFEKPIAALRIQAENLITGEQLLAEASLAPAYNETEHPLPVDVRRLSEDANGVRMELDGNKLAAGIWFFEIALREEGREDWMPIVNAEGELYAFCAAPDSYSINLQPKYAPEWKPNSATEIFARMARAIEVPLARECREDMKRLLPDAWRILGEALAGGDSGGQASLLQTCALAPSRHARRSWLPRRHPLEIEPKLFTLPAEEFGCLASSDLSGYQEFEALGLAGITKSLDDARDLLDISPAFVAAFANAATIEAAADTDPGDFAFNRYLRLLDFFDDDRLLSKQCHRKFCERMADRYATATVDGSDSPHPDAAALGRAMATVARFRQHATLSLDVPEDLAAEFPAISAAPRVISALARASRYGKPEQFWEQVSREGHFPERVRKDIGFVLRIAPELLAFYLLLWELVARNTRQCAS